MKKTQLFLFAALIACPLTSRADVISDNLSAHLNQSSLDALAKDLGSLIGGGAFHTGKALNSLFGFDVGVQVPVVRVRNDDPVLDDNGAAQHAVIGQVEIGLPVIGNLIGRYGNAAGGHLAGGGVVVSLYRSSVPGIPSASLSGLYTTFRHDDLTARVASANFILSFDVPFIHPYIGAGVDHTNVDPRDAAFAAEPPSVSRSLKGSADGNRLEAGVNLSLIPFTYLTLGASRANGENGYHLGAGVRF